MKYSIDELLELLTTEEKISLLTGVNFWDTAAVERLGIPSFKLSDGPHGVRAQDGAAGDHLGLGASAAATCFPSGAAMGSSWNVELLEEMGRALAEEAKHFGVRVLLGPAFNLKRSPLCGRSFEYFSEDPLLSGKLAAAWIRGLQSRGVSACPKHFAVNNQEDRRMISDSIVEEEVLRRLYLRSFEIAVKEAHPWAIMSAYNRINGTWCSENRNLLKTVLREEWGFDGAVVSDWGAVSNRARAAAAGLDLEMPGTGPFSASYVRQALADGSLSEEELDSCVRNILKLIERTENASPAHYTPEEHHALAERLALETIVLLKNEDGLLPLRSSGTVAVIGEMAVKPRYQGGGSSHVASWSTDQPLEELRKAMPDTAVTYCAGYRSEDCDTVDEALLDEAIRTAKESDQVLLFVGVPDGYETEGSDRKDMDLLPAHNVLADAVLEANPNTIVVLTTGAPVEMPWLKKCKALLLIYTCGDGMGNALAQILSGAESPSGKLAETFPEKLEHTPTYLSFHAEPDRAVYSEGLFVGYRWYEKTDRKPAFPFGYGLSYTSFEYSDLTAEEREDSILMRFILRNTGSRPGKECVQLYAGPETPGCECPVKELIGFRKYALDPGEEITCEFVLPRSELTPYISKSGGRSICRLWIGASSADLRLTETCTLTGSAPKGLESVSVCTTLGELADDVRTYPILCRLLEKSPMYRPDEMPDAPDFLRNLPLWTANHMSGRSLTPEQLDSWIWQFNRALHGN